MSRFEVIGVVASIGVMAMALYLLQPKTETVVSLPVTGASQSAVAVVAGDTETDLYNTLADAVAIDGSLEKLVIDDVAIGTGAEVTTGDVVSVHYIGTLQNGQQFDNSRTKGQPFSFEVGAGRVIDGWDQGLIGMKVGGQRILVVPPEMAYGNQNVGPIPANSTLIFAIELLSIE